MPLTLDPFFGVSKIQDGTVDSAAKLGNGVVTPAKTSGLSITSTPVTPLPASGSQLAVFTHGLGAVPAGAELEFVCLTAELGYAVGDVVTMWHSNGTYNTVPRVWRNATQCGAWNTNFNSGWDVARKDTGASASPTPANWAYRYRVRAV